MFPIRNLSENSFILLQNVRRVALTTFNSAAHNKPGLIRDLLADILPHLYNETKVKVSLEFIYLK